MQVSVLGCGASICTPARLVHSRHVAAGPVSAFLESQDDQDAAPPFGALLLRISIHQAAEADLRG